MKKQLLIAFLCLNTFCIYAQMMEENRIDERTHVLIQRTSWQVLSTCSQFDAYFRISQVDSTFFLNLKMIMGNQLDFSIKSGQELVFKYTNGEIAKLNCFKTVLSCIGCGTITIAGSMVPGVEAKYMITLDQFDMMRNNVPYKVKIYSNGNMVENNFEKDNYLNVQNAMKVIEK